MLAVVMGMAFRQQIAMTPITRVSDFRLFVHRLLQNDSAMQKWPYLEYRHLLYLFWPLGSWVFAALFGGADAACPVDHRAHGSGVSARRLRAGA